MIYRFIMLSDEVDGFRREYKIDGDATFMELHDVIVESVGYDKSEIASFYICDDSWNKETEITSIEMDTRSEVDSIVMADTALSDYLEDEHQKVMYVFDYLNERAFFMELREIIYGENLSEPIISKSVGDAPMQLLPIEEEEPIKVVPVVPVVPDVEEEFYTAGEFTSDSYDDEELDMDGFGDVDDEELGEEGGSSEVEEDLGY